MITYVSFAAFVHVALQICGVHGAHLTSVEHPRKLSIGKNSSNVLAVHYWLGTGETLNEISLQHVRSDQSSSFYSTILVITRSSQENSYHVSYISDSIATRTNVTFPSMSSLSAGIAFSDVVCSDGGSYRWDLSFSNGVITTVVDLPVWAHTGFSLENASLEYSPIVITEGDTVVFRCNGDLGFNPMGSLSFYLFRYGVTSPEDLTPRATFKAHVNQSECSYRGEIVTRLQMTADMNGAVMRCTIQQTRQDIDGDGYVQTNQLSVLYPAKNVTIRKDPDMDVYQQGQAFRLSCSADSNPQPFFLWNISKTETVARGSVLELTNLLTPAMYIFYCVAKVYIHGQEYSASSSVNLTVQATASSPITSTDLSTNTVQTIGFATKTQTTEQPSTSVPSTPSSSANVTKMCFSCHDMDSIGLCDAVKTCPATEDCYVKRSIFGGDYVYNSGCMDTQLCQSEMASSITASGHCTRCCSDNYCNNKGCGDGGLPPRDQRGPLCYDCQHVSSPAACHALVLCHKHQFCSMEEYEWGEYSQYRLGCRSETCGLIKRTAEGSEEKNRRAVPIRQSCCHDDFCNRNISVLASGLLGTADLVG